MIEKFVDSFSPFDRVKVGHRAVENCFTILANAEIGDYLTKLGVGCIIAVSIIAGNSCPQSMDLQLQTRNTRNQKDDPGERRANGYCTRGGRPCTSGGRPCTSGGMDENAHNLRRRHVHGTTDRRDISAVATPSRRLLHCDRHCALLWGIHFRSLWHCLVHYCAARYCSPQLGALAELADQRCRCCASHYRRYTACDWCQDVGDYRARLASTRTRGLRIARLGAVQSETDGANEVWAREPAGTRSQAKPPFMNRPKSCHRHFKLTPHESCHCLAVPTAFLDPGQLTYECAAAFFRTYGVRYEETANRNTWSNSQYSYWGSQGCPSTTLNSQTKVDRLVGRLISRD